MPPASARQRRPLRGFLGGPFVLGKAAFPRRDHPCRLLGRAADPRGAARRSVRPYPERRAHPSTTSLPPFARLLGTDFVRTNRTSRFGSLPLFGQEQGEDRGR